MTTIISFDYSTIDSQHAGSIAEHAAQIHQQLTRTAVSMIDIGRRLHEVKTVLGPVFSAWIRAEFSWSATTAHAYIKAFERFGSLECLEQFQPTALRILAAGNVPTPAVNEAINMAESGLPVTTKIAKHLADKHIVAAAGNRAPAATNRQAPAATPASATLPAVRPQEDDPFESLRSSLNEFRAGIREIVRTLTAAERQELANQLISAASEIRAIGTDDEPQPGDSLMRRKPEAVSA